MKIILYNSSAEKNRVNKNGYLDPIAELEGTLRSGTSLVNPAIVLELHDDQLKKIMDTHISVIDDDGNDVIDDDGNEVVFSYHPMTKVTGVLDISNKKRGRLFSLFFLFSCF